MLAVGLPQAKNYSNNPCLLAKNLNDESKNVYWVPNAALPCLSCKDTNPLSLVSKKQLFQLKKKFRVSDAVIKKVEKFYQSDRETLNLKEHDSLGARILVQELEQTILGSLKRKWRDSSAKFIPYYDAALSGRIALHTSAIGPSSSGKTTIVSKILLNNFEREPYGFSLQQPPAILSGKSCRRILAKKGFVWLIPARLWHLSTWKPKLGEAMF